MEYSSTLTKTSNSWEEKKISRFWLSVNSSYSEFTRTSFTSLTITKCRKQRTIRSLKRCLKLRTLSRLCRSTNSHFSRSQKTSFTWVLCPRKTTNFSFKMTKETCCRSVLKTNWLFGTCTKTSKWPRLKTTRSWCPQRHSWRRGSHF